MLDEKVIVVTGGNGLLGRQFCKTISRFRGIAIVADIAKQGIEFSKSIDNADYFPLDITDKKSIQSCIQFLKEKYGRIDALVNNAYPRNQNYGRHLFDVEYDDFCENLNLNLGGYFLVSQQFAQYFKAQGVGNIINIASVYGVIAPKFEIYDNTHMTMPVEYAAIKSGIIHLTKYFAQYLKKEGIRVNCISPGGIFDNQPESFVSAYKKHSGSQGMLPQNAISGTLTYLLSSNSKFVNGQNIVVDDGFTL